MEDAFASLPDRYLGADPGFTASYRIELDDLGVSWAVELDELSCRVTVSPKSDPDVVIGTDAATWLELREGQLSGMDAFRSRRLWARGNLDLAVAFEGFFRLPNGRPPRMDLYGHNPFSYRHPSLRNPPSSPDTVDFSDLGRFDKQVARYLRQRQSELLAEFETIVQTVSLEQ